jgi:hypothetical protein
MTDYLNPIHNMRDSKINYASPIISAAGTYFPFAYRALADSPMIITQVLA